MHSITSSMVQSSADAGVVSLGKEPLSDAACPPFSPSTRLILAESQACHSAALLAATAFRGRQQQQKKGAHHFINHYPGMSRYDMPSAEAALVRRQNMENSSSRFFQPVDLEPTITQSSLNLARLFQQHCLPDQSLLFLRRLATEKENALCQQVKEFRNSSFVNRHFSNTSERIVPGDVGFPSPFFGTTSSTIDEKLVLSCLRLKKGSDNTVYDGTEIDPEKIESERAPTFSDTATFSSLPHNFGDQHRIFKLLEIAMAVDGAKGGSGDKDVAAADEKEEQKIEIGQLKKHDVSSDVPQLSCSDQDHSTVPLPDSGGMRTTFAHIRRSSQTLYSSPKIQQPFLQDPLKAISKRRARTFAQKLMDVLLNHCHDEEAAAWLPDGRSFAIINPTQFVSVVMTQVFDKPCKYESFTRRLNRWKFVRMKSGIGVDIFSHELFRRDKIELVLEMTCKEGESQPNKDPSKFRLKTDTVHAPVSLSVTSIIEPLATTTTKVLTTGARLLARGERSEEPSQRFFAIEERKAMKLYASKEEEQEERNAKRIKVDGRQ